LPQKSTTLGAARSIPQSFETRFSNAPQADGIGVSKDSASRSLARGKPQVFDTTG